MPRTKNVRHFDFSVAILLPLVQLNRASLFLFIIYFFYFLFYNLSDTRGGGSDDQEESRPTKIWTSNEGKRATKGVRCKGCLKIKYFFLPHMGLLGWVQLGLDGPLFSGHYYFLLSAAAHVGNKGGSHKRTYSEETTNNCCTIWIIVRHMRFSYFQTSQVVIWEDGGTGNAQMHFTPCLHKLFRSPI
jgi:hypothetical protein